MGGSSFQGKDLGKESDPTSFYALSNRTAQLNPFKVDTTEGCPIGPGSTLQKEVLKEASKTHPSEEFRAGAK